MGSDEIQFRLEFELDWEHNLRYRIEITNTELMYSDNLPTNYMPWSPMLIENAGEQNGSYVINQIALEKLKTFIEQKVIHWDLYYPLIATESYQKWELKIEIGDVRLLTNGRGNFPDEFEQFKELINDLFTEEKEGHFNWLALEKDYKEDEED